MGKTTTGGHPELKMVNPCAAAVDIESTMHMAAVNPDSSADFISGLNPRQCGLAAATRSK